MCVRSIRVYQLFCYNPAHIIIIIASSVCVKLAKCVLGNMLIKLAISMYY